MCVTLGINLLRHTFFFLNITLLIFAFGFIGYGVIININLNLLLKTFQDLDAYSKTAPVLLVLVGFCVFGVTCLGFCGELRSDRRSLYMYAITIFVLLCLQTILGGLAFIQFSDTSSMIKKMGKQFQESMGKYNIDPNVQAAIDSLQSKLKCCGVKKPSDWTSELPTSCCKDNPDYCNVTAAYKSGCVPQMYIYVKDSTFFIGTIVLLVAVLELCAGISGCCIGWYV